VSKIGLGGRLKDYFKIIDQLFVVSPQNFTKDYKLLILLIENTINAVQ